MGRWEADLRARLAALRLAAARETEIIEELSQHLDEHYEELRAGGADHDEARRLALEELSEGGGITRLDAAVEAGPRTSADRS